MKRSEMRLVRRAFTLVELLLVLVILAVLAAAVLPNLVGRSEQASITRAKTDIAAIENALTTFNIDNRRFPTNDEGLSALVEAPADVASTWNKGGYLKSGVMPKDPWNRPYNYQIPASRSKGAYDLWSNGPDGREGGDDIGNWE